MRCRTEGIGRTAWKTFDVVVEDAMAGMENWEEAESTLQQLAVDKLLEKWDGKKKICVIFLQEICWGS